MPLRKKETFMKLRKGRAAGAAAVFGAAIALCTVSCNVVGRINNENAQQDSTGTAVVDEVETTEESTESKPDKVVHALFGIQECRSTCRRCGL